MRTLNWLSLGATLSALFASSTASASGFATARFGGEHGHPTTDNPTALYYNPAGIAEDNPDYEKKLWRVRVMADANIALRWASFSHKPSEFDSPDPEDAKEANSGEATLFNVVVAPMAAATFQIENFGLGVGFFVPFGGASSWDKNDKFTDDPNYAGPVDGVQRWHTIDGTLRSIYVTVGAAYDILDRVSIGASLNIIKSEVKTVRARNASGDNAVPTEGRSLIDVSGWNGSFGLGVIGEVAENKVWIGFSYQSQPGLGEMALEGTLKNKYGKSDSTITDVKLLQELPDIYRLGVRARPIPVVELRFFGDLTNWSVFDRQCIIPAEGEDCPINDDGSFAGTDNVPYLNLARNWGPAFGLRAGGSYWVIPALELFLGAGYDSNAVPDETLEPALTDFQKASLAGGLRFSIAKTFGMAISYTHLFYVPRDTSGLSKLPTYEAPSKSPDSGGNYTQTIGVINTNAEVSF
jgi:long-chain fatty acid transport protein